MSGMSTSKVQLCIAAAIGAAGAMVGSTIWFTALGFSPSRIKANEINLSILAY